MTTAVKERETESVLIHQQQKFLAIVDLDDSLYRGIIMEDLIEDQVRTGLLSANTAPEIWEQIHEYKNGQKSSATNVKGLNASWAAALKNKYYPDLMIHAREFVNARREKFQPYTADVLKLLQERGYHVCLITGEPPFVAEAVKNIFPITSYFASGWALDCEMYLTGEVLVPMTSRQKGIFAEFLLSPKFGYQRNKSLAVIDSLNDIGLADAVPCSVVCSGGTPGLIDHLSKSGRNFVIASAENTLRFVDVLTR